MGTMALPKLLSGLFTSSKKERILPPPKPHLDEKRSVDAKPGDLEKSTSDAFEQSVTKPIHQIVGKPLPHQKATLSSPPPKPVKEEHMATTKKQQPSQKSVSTPKELQEHKEDSSINKHKESSHQPKEPADQKADLQEKKKQATMKVIEELMAAQEDKQAVEDVAKHTPPKQSYKKNNPFYLESGETLHSVDDLRRVAETMSEETFSHHVNEHRNDFAHWLSSSVGDKQAARRVQGVRSTDELYTVLSDGMDVLPDAKSVSKEIPDTDTLPSMVNETVSEDVETIHNQFVTLKQDINAEIDESIQMLASQSKRIADLRQEVEKSTQVLQQNERELREELSLLQENQSELEEQIKQLQEENTRLAAERDEAKKVQQEVQEIRTELAAKHEELVSARKHLEDEVHNSKSSVTKKSSSSVDILIDTIKKDLAANRIHAARNAYNEARNMYYTSHSLSASQREELHQELLDLYAQINISDTK